MPNLEIHYREGVEDLLNFDKLGKDSQSALAKAFNHVNKAGVNPKDVLVRFILASKYDQGIPDICFVIKCGREGLTKDKQLDLCELFDKYLGFYGIFFEKKLTRDIEIFNTQSHGIRKNASNIVEFEF